MPNLIKTPTEIENMRESGRRLGLVLQEVAAATVPGITTAGLDEVAVKTLQRLGGDPAFFGHEGFPKTICISVNDELVHGIPGDRIIMTGDIVGLDYGVRYNGMITDSAITVPVGKVAKPTQRLLDFTEAALYIGIDQARAGNRVGDISAAIEQHLRKAGLGVVRELAGHGVGHELWEEPTVPNLGKAGSGPLLKAGMTIAIEPMAAVGRPGIEILEDNWTIVMRDGTMSAQFEHTVLITNGAPEILTSVAVK